MTLVTSRVGCHDCVARISARPRFRWWSEAGSLAPTSICPRAVGGNYRTTWPPWPRAGVKSGRSSVLRRAAAGLAQAGRSTEPCARWSPARKCWATIAHAVARRSRGGGADEFLSMGGQERPQVDLDGLHGGGGLVAMGHPVMVASMASTILPNWWSGAASSRKTQ